MSTPGRLGLTAISSAIFIDGVGRICSAGRTIGKSVEADGQADAVGGGAEVEGCRLAFVVAVFHPVQAALADDLERDAGGKGGAAQGRDHGGEQDDAPAGDGHVFVLEIDVSVR